MDEDIYRRLADAAGVPFVALDPTDVDLAAARLVPAELARRFGIVPTSIGPAGLTIVTARPDDEAARTAVQGLTGRPVEVVVSTPDRIAAAQLHAFGAPPVVRVPRHGPPALAPEPHADVLRRVAHAAGVDFTVLADLEAEVDPAAARLLGERLSRRFGLLAVATRGGEIVVAGSHPFARGVLGLVEQITALRPVLVLAPSHRISAGLDRVFAGGGRLAIPETPPRVGEPGQRLGELLVAEGVVDRATLARALALHRRTGDRLGRILVAYGYAGRERIAETVAQQLQLPYVRGSQLRPAPDAEALLPQSLCRSHHLVPLGVVDEQLVVAMADPVDPEAVKALRAASTRPLRVVVAAEDAIAAELERLYAHDFVEISTTELLRRRPDESAYRVLTPPQRLAGLLLVLAVALGLVVAPIVTLISLTTLAVGFYFATSIYKFALVRATVGRQPELPVGADELALLDEQSLPRYTILVPLYHEAVVTTQLLGALERLDYPTSKLDVKLLLEEDDAETIAAVREHLLPAHFHAVVVPDAPPKTKPKACNYGLLQAQGEYVVIYDAEDVPEPDQLKKAVLAFRKAPADVACVQAKLNYWNREQNLLTRWFTTEYSMWFDLFLPGLNAQGAPIPLGGTSNHFALERLLELGAWDPFNVTEDADLGVRLARAGWRTAMIDSTTFEEANSRLYNWVRQRSRWVKGYIQTWLVHMRHPVRLWRELGPSRFLSFQLVVGGTPLTMLLNPLFWLLTSLWALTAAEVIRSIFPGPVYFAGAFNLFIGNFVFTYLNVAGTMRRGYHELVKYALFSPLYWALMSVGAWKGLFQLVTRPSYWEKTVHGLAEARR